MTTTKRMTDDERARAERVRRISERDDRFSAMKAAEAERDRQRDWVAFIARKWHRHDGEAEVTVKLHQAVEDLERCETTLGEALSRLTAALDGIDEGASS